MSDETVDFAEAFREDWDDIPEDTGPGGGVRPEVWCLANVVEAENKWDEKKDPKIPVVQVKMEIVRSAADAAGRVAKGKAVDWLSKPQKVHPQLNETRNRILREHTRKFYAATLAPYAKDKAEADVKILAQISALGTDKAPIGKQVLFKFVTNDGKDKNGVVTYQLRADDPRSEVSNYLAPTPENISRYIDGITI
jgi:hypothetical protein